MITNEIDNLLIFQISYRRINTLSSNRKKTIIRTKYSYEYNKCKYGCYDKNIA